MFDQRTPLHPEKFSQDALHAIGHCVRGGLKMGSVEGLDIGRGMESS